MLNLLRVTIMCSGELSCQLRAQLATTSKSSS